jgi:hypothetical protein
MKVDPNPGTVQSSFCSRHMSQPMYLTPVFVSAKWSYTLVDFMSGCAPSCCCHVAPVSAF